VLRDALGWNMTAARWAQVHDVVVEMASAAANGSPEGLWRSAGSLELFSPPRVITRMGDTRGDTPPTLPAPKAVRGRIVELVDALSPPGRSQVDAAPGVTACSAERAPQE
jgi:hypothetical protein